MRDALAPWHSHRGGVTAIRRACAHRVTDSVYWLGYEVHLCSTIGVINILCSTVHLRMPLSGGLVRASGHGQCGRAGRGARGAIH